MRAIDALAPGVNGVAMLIHLYRFATYGSVDAVYFGMGHAAMFGWCMAMTVAVIVARRAALVGAPEGEEAA